MPDTDPPRDCPGVQAIYWPFWSRFQQAHARTAELLLFDGVARLRFTDGTTTLYGIEFKMVDGWPAARLMSVDALSPTGLERARVRRDQLLQFAAEQRMRELAELDDELAAAGVPVAA